MSYLDTAFIAVWIVLAVYILNLIRIRRGLDKELKTLESLK